MYVFVDQAGRITACNPNDLSGNTDWEYVSETIGEPLTNENGVPLYKYHNGHAAPRTAGELAADTPWPDTPTPTELEQLRADVDFIAMETGVDI